MNPKNTIRPWLLACGKQWGISQVHDYRWPDAETRPQKMYFTYQMMSYGVGQVGHQSMDTDAGSNKAILRAWQELPLTVKVDLYKSEDGLYELAACCVAANKIPAIKHHFERGGVAFKQVTSLVNNSTFDGERVDYHQTLICTFIENVEISLDSEANAILDEIELTLVTGDPTWEISRSGYKEKS